MPEVSFKELLMVPDGPPESVWERALDAAYAVPEEDAAPDDPQLAETDAPDTDAIATTGNEDGPTRRYFTMIPGWPQPGMKDWGLTTATHHTVTPDPTAGTDWTMVMIISMTGFWAAVMTPDIKPPQSFALGAAQAVLSTTTRLLRMRNCRRARLGFNA